MKIESITDVNRSPKRLTAANDIVLVTHYNDPAGVWIPFQLLDDLEALMKMLKLVVGKQS